MNTTDILLVSLIILVLIRAFMVVYRSRKQGKGCLGCGGNCSGCSYQCSFKEHHS